MKAPVLFVISCVALLEACQHAPMTQAGQPEHAPMNLVNRPGWRFERIGSTKFRVFVNGPKDTANKEAFAVAADLALTNGYRFFAVIPDGDYQDSGTKVERGSDTYDGRPGMLIMTIGSSFLIDCDTKAPAFGGIFDARAEIQRFRQKRS